MCNFTNTQAIFHFNFLQSWADWKSSIKEKTCKIHQYKNKTGGGTPPELVLTPLEERVGKICGKFQMRGDDEICEFGFGPMQKKSKTSQGAENINNTNTNNNNVSISQISAQPVSTSNAIELNVRKRLFNEGNDDIVFLADDDSFNLTTPQKQTTPHSINSTPKSRRFVSNRNQTEVALALQKENNETLKIIASQNVKIIARLDKVIDLLENKKSV